MCTNEIGFGLGLRPEHYEEIATNPGRVSWFEALSENFRVPGGGPLRGLDRIRRNRWRCRACRSRSSRSKAASSHCESHGASKGGEVLQALGRPKKFGRHDFSRRPMAWIRSTDRRAIRILGYLAGQGTPTFLWSATE